MSRYFSKDNILEIYAQATAIDTLAVQADNVQHIVQQLISNISITSAASGKMTTEDIQLLNKYNTIVLGLSKQIKSYPGYRENIKLTNILNIVNNTYSLITNIMRAMNVK